MSSFHFHSEHKVLTCLNGYGSVTLKHLHLTGDLLPVMKIGFVKNPSIFDSQYINI